MTDARIGPNRYGKSAIRLVKSFAGPFAIAELSPTDSNPRKAARLPNLPPNSQSKPAMPIHNADLLAAWLSLGRVLSSIGA